MSESDFIVFINVNINKRLMECSCSCSRIHRCALRYLRQCVGDSLLFSEFTVSLVKRYESFLSCKCLSLNTISAYIRAIRSDYNQAVEQGLAPFVPGLFRHVYTGIDGHAERALDSGVLRCIASSPALPLPASLEQSRLLFVLLFLLRGIPFVDMIHLRKCDLRGGVLTYRRQKTGKRLTVVLTPEATAILEILRSRCTDSPYLFPFIRHSATDTYREYQNSLRRFNYCLARLAPALGLEGVHLSSYVARHSWATLAIGLNENMKLVSTAMGHSSVKVTENYLKQATEKQIDAMNRRVIAEVFMEVNKSPVTV